MADDTSSARSATDGENPDPDGAALDDALQPRMTRLIEGIGATGSALDRQADALTALIRTWRQRSEQRAELNRHIADVDSAITELSRGLGGEAETDVQAKAKADPASAKQAMENLKKLRGNAERMLDAHDRMISILAQFGIKEFSDSESATAPTDGQS